MLRLCSGLLVLQERVACHAVSTLVHVAMQVALPKLKEYRVLKQHDNRRRQYCHQNIPQEQRQMALTLCSGKKVQESRAAHSIAAASYSITSITQHQAASHGITQHQVKVRPSFR